MFVLRTIPDSRRIRAWLAERSCRDAVVVGGGFIGLEMAENLVHRGLSVTVVEKLPTGDATARPRDGGPARGRTWRAKGVKLRLGDGAQRGSSRPAMASWSSTDRGNRIAADMVILVIGIRPETRLAQAAGLVIGKRGGIVVDEQMRTSDPAIYAVGDAIEVHDVVIGQGDHLPLAGPANRQGRVAAEAIAGRTARFRGVQGTAVVGVLGLTAGMTGASEKGLRRAGLSDFERRLSAPRAPRRLLPGRPAHPPEAPLLARPTAASSARRPSARRGSTSASTSSPRDPDGRHRARPGGGRALLRAAVRRGEGPRQRGGHDGEQRSLAATCRWPTGRG